MNKEDIYGNDLQTIITQGLSQIKERMGRDFDVSRGHLAEMQRITGSPAQGCGVSRKTGLSSSPMAGQAERHAGPSSQVSPT